ncbi:MAG: molybdenum cofactor biosynthesis protein MoaE [Bacteroidia bacterium]|jgi:molybdopterin synthase catalytic subunit
MSSSPKNIFTLGPITPAFIAESIAKHQTKTSIGAHDLFLGQVRADVKDGHAVEAIHYTANEELALNICQEIREEAFQKFQITCLHIHHSLGEVKTGEICFFVFVSSPHRKASFDACEWLVNEIKEKCPIWGEEKTAEKSFWKENHG